MKKTLIAVGAALLLGAATFATSVTMVGSAEAKSPGRSWGGSSPGKVYGGSPGKVYGGGPVKFSSGSIKYSGVSPGKVYFNKPGKHPRFVKHRFHRTFFVSSGLYGYGYYDECIRWHPAYGWINVCYPYGY